MVTIQSLRYGVEIECGGQTRETVAHAVQAVVGGTVHRIGSASVGAWGVRAPDGRAWSVVADSSLAAYPPDQRVELVTPILTWDDLSVLQEVVRALRGAGCITNDQTGLHVHVGAERFSGKALAIPAKQVYANEALIFHAFAVSDERKARYTRPLDPAFTARLLRSRVTTRDAFFRCWYGARTYTPTRYHPSRYTLVNMNSAALRDTVEFRAYTPDGLHAGKIKAAIVFSLVLCARALNTRAATARQKTYDPRSAKYDMRVLLLHLNLSGPAHRNTRKHLLARMPGDAAFKYAEQRPKAQCRSNKRLQ
jgi:hypothetical protein